VAVNECYIQTRRRGRELSRPLGGQRERNLRSPVPRRAGPGATCRIPGVPTPTRARPDCSSRRVRGPGRAPRCHRTHQLARAPARRPASHFRRRRPLRSKDIDKAVREAAQRSQLTGQSPAGDYPAAGRTDRTARFPGRMHGISTTGRPPQRGLLAAAVLGLALSGVAAGCSSTPAGGPGLRCRFGAQRQGTWQVPGRRRRELCRAPGELVNVSRALIGLASLDRTGPWSG
jgi:hypothetical protein